MYWNKKEINQNIDKIKKIFFFRICGTGMGAAACLLREKGYEVEGADLNFYPPMSDYLERMKIPCHQIETITKEKLEEFDLVVVGNVVPRGSEHAQLIESLNTAYSSFPAAMGALILKECNVIGITGTHSHGHLDYWEKIRKTINMPMTQFDYKKTMNDLWSKFYLYDHSFRTYYG